MPIVKNETEYTKFWNEFVFKPGEEKKINFLVPPELGLTLISEEPRVLPRCLAADSVPVTSGESVEIPIPMCEVFRASFICLPGKAEVRQNYEDAQAVPITPDVEYEIQYRRADVEKVILTGVEDAYVVYDIEKVM